jgi:hypothetical protein
MNVRRAPPPESRHSYLYPLPTVHHAPTSPPAAPSGRRATPAWAGRAAAGRGAVHLAGRATFTAVQVGELVRASLGPVHYPVPGRFVIFRSWLPSVSTAGPARLLSVRRSSPA